MIDEKAKDEIKARLGAELIAERNKLTDHLAAALEAYTVTIPDKIPRDDANSIAGFKVAVINGALVRILGTIQAQTFPAISDARMIKHAAKGIEVEIGLARTMRRALEGLETPPAGRGH